MIMFEKFLEVPRKKVLILTAIISFVSVIILILVMDLFDDGMIPFTIIDFEFSWTGSRSQEIMTAWESNGGLQSSIIFNYLDFAFMLAYGSFGFSILVLLARSFNENEKHRKIGLICSVLPIVSAVFDVIENINLLIMQHNFPLTPLDIMATIASISAFIKFGALIIAIIFMLYGLSFSLVMKLKRAEKND